MPELPDIGCSTSEEQEKNQYDNVIVSHQVSLRAEHLATTGLITDKISLIHQGAFDRAVSEALHRISFADKAHKIRTIEDRKEVLNVKNVLTPDNHAAAATEDLYSTADVEAARSVADAFAVMYQTQIEETEEAQCRCELVDLETLMEDAKDQAYANMSDAVEGIIDRITQHLYTLAIDDIAKEQLIVEMRAEKEKSVRKGIRRDRKKMRHAIDHMARVHLSKAFKTWKKILADHAWQSELFVCIIEKVRYDSLSKAINRWWDYFMVFKEQEALLRKALSLLQRGLAFMWTKWKQVYRQDAVISRLMNKTAIHASSRFTLEKYFKPWNLWIKDILRESKRTNALKLQSTSCENIEEVSGKMSIKRKKSFNRALARVSLANAAAESADQVFVSESSQLEMLSDLVTGRPSHSKDTKQQKYREDIVLARKSVFHAKGLYCLNCKTAVEHMKQNPCDPDAEQTYMEMSVNALIADAEANVASAEVELQEAILAERRAELAPENERKYQEQLLQYTKSWSQLCSRQSHLWNSKIKLLREVLNGLSCHEQVLTVESEIEEASQAMSEAYLLLSDTSHIREHLLQECVLKEVAAKLTAGTKLNRRRKLRNAWIVWSRWTAKLVADAIERRLMAWEVDGESFSKKNSRNFQPPQREPTNTNDDSNWMLKVMVANRASAARLATAAQKCSTFHLHEKIGFQPDEREFEIKKTAWIIAIHAIAEAVKEKEVIEVESTARKSVWRKEDVVCELAFYEAEIISAESAEAEAYLGCLKMTVWALQAWLLENGNREMVTSSPYRRGNSSSIAAGVRDIQQHRLLTVQDINILHSIWSSMRDVALKELVESSNMWNCFKVAVQLTKLSASLAEVKKQRENLVWRQAELAQKMAALALMRRTYDGYLSIESDHANLEKQLRESLAFEAAIFKAFCASRQTLLGLVKDPSENQNALLMLNPEIEALLAEAWYRGVFRGG